MKTIKEEKKTNENNKRGKENQWKHYKRKRKPMKTIKEAKKTNENIKRGEETQWKQ